MSRPKADPATVAMLRIKEKEMKRAGDSRNNSFNILANHDGEAELDEEREKIMAYEFHRKEETRESMRHGVVRATKKRLGQAKRTSLQQPVSLNHNVVPAQANTTGRNAPIAFPQGGS